jgi:DNA polymerase-3 subunit delta'
LEGKVLNFEDIIGHENIKLQIINSINAGTFSHAHIFSGEDGIGKSLVARAAALKLLKKEKYRQYADIIVFRLLLLAVGSSLSSPVFSSVLLFMK